MDPLHAGVLLYLTRTAGALTVDRIWLDHFPYQTFLPRHPEPVEEQEPDERLPGLIDESN